MYTLHHDTEAFRTLITQISLEQSIAPEIIEKDYYVTLILQEIAEKQKEYEVFFKGGTALYKALKSINRFSEDIDLTFNDQKFESTTAKKRALKMVTSKYSSSLLDPGAEDSVSGSGSRTSIYTYPTLFELDTFKNDTLSRIGKLKVETTSFTTSSPIADYEIEPVLFTYANEEFKKLLEMNYEVKPFMIQCVTIERIFIDKLFAIEDYYLGEHVNRTVEMAKHMYDIHQLYMLPNIKKFMESFDDLKTIIEIKIEEQTRRREAKTVDKKIMQFEYFGWIQDDKIEDTFNEMQRIYVFQTDFNAEFKDVRNSFKHILEEIKTFNL